MTSNTVFVTPEALAVAKRLPGKMRQRVKRSIDGLQNEPRPAESKRLDFPDPDQFPGLGVEVRRLRLDKWRVLYSIREEEKVVDVLAIRKRPPYDYGDLQELLGYTGETDAPDNQ
jgi:mRNA interferase RelE/StbE